MEPSGAFPTCFTWTPKPRRWAERSGPWGGLRLKINTGQPCFSPKPQSDAEDGFEMPWGTGW